MTRTETAQERRQRFRALGAAYEDEPGYPVDRYRKGGTIVIEIEVSHDLDGQELAEDLGTAARRLLRSRGCQLWGESSSYRPAPLFLPPSKLSRRQPI